MITMQKAICVSNLPGSLVKEDSWQKVLSQHFSKAENGGAEVSKCHVGVGGNAAVFLTLKVSIEGRLRRVRCY